MDADNNIVVAQVLDERLNNDIEAAVNLGLAAALLGEVHDGMRLMQELGVPYEISSRVLLNKTKRRSSDWK
ncbi:hypothetical protein [Solimicrobium silvestre]|uniref:Uncharacterized protein n=1 Tax=Solimicrobium silvestre TaxID=2099400 RepID=A0A2S9GVW3_9BURK|nr:hypothetical protein [Solimicrobium silvestre]PRC91838.1 hypothetical protein S2091_3394 [Solimicrobium silvestre]